MVMNEEESIMSRNRAVSMLAVALIAMSASLPAWAGKGHYHGGHGHGHSHGSVSFGFAFGGPWYYPGYYYPPPYYYYPQPVRTEPTVYIERGDAGAPADPSQGSNGYWYYCKESKTYHPYVKHCPGGWEKQVPAPAPGR
jgi:hypothetical protein